MYTLKLHHRNLLTRLGLPNMPAAMLSHDTKQRARLELAATDINYGRLCVSFKPGTSTLSGGLHHRVRIMEPGSSRVHFIDCEVPV